jgi:hypothetical protein
MPREQLNVAQAAAGAVDIPRRNRDETSSARMRRAALEAEFFEQRDEPIDPAVRLQMRAAIRTDDGSNRLRGLRQALQSAPQVRMHRNGPAPRFFAMASRTLMVPETRPRGSSTLDQSSPAISQARKPALIESNIIARSRAGCEDEHETWRSMRFNIGGVTTLACLPGQGSFLLRVRGK